MGAEKLKLFLQERFLQGEKKEAFCLVDIGSVQSGINPSHDRLNWLRLLSWQEAI